MPPPTNAIVISANCHNSSASGDYQIAGQLTYSFAKELNGASNNRVFQSIASLATQGKKPNSLEIILLTTADRLASFTRLYGERNTFLQVKVNDVFIKLYSDDEFPINDYHVIGYISANPCRSMPQDSLKKILSPETQVLFVYGPHQPDINASPLRQFRFSLEQTSPLFSAFSYTLPRQEALGFTTDGGHRLGLFPVSQAKALLLSDKDEAMIQALPQQSDYAPIYLNHAKDIEPETREFIELAISMTKNFIFFGDYAVTLKTLIKRLPYSITYNIGGATGQIDKIQFEINIKHFQSIEHHAFRRLMAGGIPLVVASGVNSVQETLTDDRIVYLQDLELNQIFIDSYLQSLMRYTKTHGMATASENKEAVTLASLLMKEKPLMLPDKQVVKALLAQPEVMSRLQQYNQGLMLASQKPIAKKLLPMLLKPYASSIKDKQLTQALVALRKSDEMTDPTIGQALRRAAGLPNKLFELKILVAYCKKEGINLDAVVEDKKITPLHYAAQLGRIENIILLLRAGSNMNLRDYLGRNPAYYAAFKGHVQCLSTLISFGANITHCSSDGRSALEICRASPELKRCIDNATPTINEHSAMLIQTQLKIFFARKRKMRLLFKTQEQDSKVTKKARTDWGRNTFFFAKEEHLRLASSAPIHDKGGEDTNNALDDGPS